MKYIGVNGVPTPSEEAVISVMDHGFMYGMGLFETFRTYGGRPFLLDEHLERLRSGCMALGMRYPFADGTEGSMDPSDVEQLTEQIAELMKLNELKEAYIRLTVSAGEGPLGLPSGVYEEPKIIVYVKPLPDISKNLYTGGKSLWRLHTPRNTPEGEVRFKSLHYMNNILAKRELAAYGEEALGGEGLMLTGEGYLAEGIVSNLFFVQNGKLYTPEIATGILPGITRGIVLELAHRHGIECEEGLFVWDQLLLADEVFVTNSIQELVPVTRLVEPENKQGQQFKVVRVGNEGIGSMTRMLLHSYREEAKQYHAD